MDASVSQIIIAIVGSGGVVSILWGWGNANKKEYVDSLLGQIKVLKENADVNDKAKSLAEKQAGALEIKVAFLKQQLHTTVKALDRAQVQIDPGSMIGRVSLPPEENEPSAVLYIEAEKRSSYFLGEENERRRQRPLNPSAEKRDREWINESARRYLNDEEDSEPPTRR